MTGVVAMTRAGCIGRDGEIPWHHKEDLRHFKRLTTGGTVVMGRKTWDSLPVRPLPRRDNVVLTRHPTTVAMPDATFTSLDGIDGVLEASRAPVFVIGGAQIYEALWSRIDTWHVTIVDDVVEDGDTFFPRRLEDDHDAVERTTLSEHCEVVRYVRRHPA